MAEATYLLMDARAGLMGPDDATVILAGTCQECCEAANAGEYGENCCVVGPDGEVAWELFHTGKWSVDGTSHPLKEAKSDG